MGDGQAMTPRDHFLAERWDNFRALARYWLREARTDALPDLPPLTADQRRPVNHRVLRAAAPPPPGRAGAPAGGVSRRGPALRTRTSS